MPTVTIQPAAVDTEMASGTPTTNYNTDVNLRVAQTNWRTLIKFDLSTIPPGSVIVSAAMSLYLWGDFTNVPLTISVFRVKRAWVGAQATWNVYSTGNSWQTAGCDGANDRESTAVGALLFASANPTLNQWYTWALDPVAINAMTDGVWTNNGFLLKTESGGDHLIFYSSDYGTASLRPKLTIDYIDPAGRLAKYRVNGLLAGARLRTGLERAANRIWIRYEESTLKRSTNQEDAESQARYGIKEMVMSGGQISTDVANRAAKTYLDITPDASTPDISLSASYGVVRDQFEDRVPPEQIRPNNWIAVDGLPRPTSKVQTSLLKDPGMAYIEEVEYDEDSDRVSIKSGRDRFAETLVNRLVGRA